MAMKVDTSGLGISQSLTPGGVQGGATHKRGGTAVGADESVYSGAGGIKAVMTVEGYKELADALEACSSMVVAATVMTAKAAAEGIYWLSQRHCPEDTRALLNSAGDGPHKIAGSHLAGGEKISVVGSQVEGGADWLAALGGAKMVGPGYFPTHVQYGKGAVAGAYVKWAVSYNRDNTAFYAALVHENLLGWHFPTRARAKYRDRKTDHFLSNAFDQIAPVFSQATTRAIKDAIDVIHAYALRTAPKKAGPGGGRLVKKGG